MYLNWSTMSWRKSKFKALYVAIMQKDFKQVQTLLLDKANLQDENGDFPLIIASSGDSLDILQYLIERTEDINKKNNKGLTAFHVASLNKYSYIQIQVMKILLDRGAQVDTTDEKEHTPLLDAASSGKLPLVQFLVENGANVNYRTTQGTSPLHSACWNRSIEVVEYLASRGADVNNVMRDKLIRTSSFECEDSRGRVILDTVMRDDQIFHRTPLRDATLDGLLGIVKCLVQNGANVDYIDDEGYTPLLHAALCGHLEIVKYLVENGANVNYRTSKGISPLHAACWEDKIEVVEYLAKQGADVNNIATSKVQSGTSPIMDAAYKGRFEMVKCLERNGADIHFRNNKGTTVLHSACVSFHNNFDMELVKFLIEKGIDLKKVDIEQHSPLHVALKHKHLNLIKILIQNGASIDCIDGRGNTPLLDAAHCGYLEGVIILVRNGATIDCINGRGYTPLLDAAHCGYLAVVIFLVKKGANVNYRTSNGMSPLHAASLKNKIEIVEFLAKHGADVNNIVTNKKQITSTPIMDAAYNNFFEMVKCLEKNGADIHFRNNKGTTVMHSACLKGNRDIVKFLIDKGIDLKTVSTGQYSPLHVENENKNLHFLEFLIKNGAQMYSAPVSAVKNKFKK